MALTLVGGATSSAHAAATSVAKTVTSPTLGNIMVVVFSSLGSTVGNLAVTDNQGNTWTQVFTQFAESTLILSCWTAKVTATGATFTITFNGGTGTTNCHALYQEWSGQDATTPVPAGENGTNGATTGTAASTPSVTNNVNPNSVFFFTETIGGASTITENGGFTVGLNDASFAPPLGLWYSIVSTTAARNDTWTNGTSHPWAAAIFDIQAPAVSSQVPYQPNYARAPFLAT